MKTHATLSDLLKYYNDWMGININDPNLVTEEDIQDFVNVNQIDSLKNERYRIWKELCKNERDGAFTSVLELEADDVYDMIFNGKETNKI